MVEAHADDITCMQFVVIDRQVYMVTAGLDCHVRKWLLADLLAGRQVAVASSAFEAEPSRLSAEEEQQLAELMSDEE